MRASKLALATEESPLLGNASNGSYQASSRSPADVEDGRNNALKGTDEPKDGDPVMAKKMHLILPAVGVGIYLVAIDQLLAVATGTKIGNELNSLNNISWIATSYFLTLTSCQPLYGKLSDIFGRKECLLFAYAVFGVGCLGCGLAQNMLQLCAFRALAGIGGGGMNSVVAILLSDIVPLRDRGIWQGYINIIFAAGTSTGAPLGGIAADYLGWRWSFILQTPLCVVAWLAVYFVLDIPPTSHDHWLAKLRRIDFLGAFTLVLAVVALLAGLDFGSNFGWSHLFTIVSLCLTLPLSALFIFVETRVATNPFAPGRIIFDPNILACYLANFFGSAGYFGILFFLPLYFQAVEGFSATMSGVLLVPAMIFSVVASLGGGVFPIILSVWHRFTPGETIGLIMTAIGGGSGMTTTLVGLLAHARPKDSAMVVACSYLFRSLGSSIGISVNSAVLQQTLRLQLFARLDSGTEAREIEERVRQSLDCIKELPGQVAEQVRASYQVATLGALMPTLFFVTVSFIVTFWVKEKVLKR
ncbi:major facilitator superfamily protein [Hirsutella rhossiliensis]|uniref:Major facilitator superfamily domain-containing protein n=1 Tax=Hirsutella rhossiliensis TaxID=111463 RepID=A0A9P8N7P8_9HYPO|nr:major facilitator superfamily domain-containing protein [Hirsutella rhossiliensis]KAH0968505.1 major facilitator superfamily domain-containing protein [Hirsutella rhossiliensis]